MKKRLISVAKSVGENAVLQKSVHSLKPKWSILGVIGVLLFFILPEILGFIWGKEINDWAHFGTLTEETESG